MFWFLVSLVRLILSPLEVREIAVENLAFRQQLANNEETMSATAAAPDRPPVLGVVVDGLEGLAQGAADREA